MFRHPAVIATLLAFSVVIGACSSDDSNGAADSGTDSTAAVGDSPAPGGSGDTAAAPSGAIDCAAVESAFGALIVNSQVVVQFAGQADVTQWSTIVGTMDQFGTQLDTLRALEPYGADVKASIDFFAGANDITQRGFAGDTAAAAELATFVGTDIGAALAKRTPLAIAFDATDC